MSQIQNLRSYILEELDRHDEISLVKVIAKFDFYQHAIPTLNELLRAIEGTDAVRVIRKENRIFLRKMDGGEAVKISEAEMQSSYEAYIQNIRRSK